MQSIWSDIKAVRDFDNFNEDNDPHGEHDFGAINWYGERTYWKIDYYAADGIHGAEDPTTPDTMRVLVVLLASEY